MGGASRRKRLLHAILALLQHAWKNRLNKGRRAFGFPVESKGFLQFPVESLILPFFRQRPSLKPSRERVFTGFFTM